MTYRYVITTEKEVDVDDIGAYLSGMPEFGEYEYRWDIRPDDDWGTIRCAGEAHDTFAKLLAQIVYAWARLPVQGRAQGAR